MDTMAAFARGSAARASGAPMMVFDWKRAATLIKERGAKHASAGLAGDWEWTGGDILSDGIPIPRGETCVYLASIWATPELEIDGERMDCFCMQSDSPGWDSDTYWPPEALAILNGE